MWRRVARDERADEGFSLVEVILAMVIIAGVLATMMGIVISSLTTVAQARQRQTATALATQAMEEMRALPYNTVTQHDSLATPDATAVYAISVAGQWRLGLDISGRDLPGLTGQEALVLNDVSGRTDDVTVDEVTYRVHTYVTLATTAPGAQQSFNLTSVIAYTSNVSKGQRVTVQRSVTFSPTGCLSTAQNPFAAPCQAYFTANAGQTLGGVTVSNPLDSTLPVLGFEEGTLLDIGLSNNSATVRVEQTATGNANSSTSSVRKLTSVESESGGLVASTSVDSDPSSTTNQAESANVSQSAGPLSLTGTAGTLTASPWTSGSGQARSAIFADSAQCTGLAGGLATGPDSTHLRPCSSSSASDGGSMLSVIYKPTVPAGFSSMDIAILRAVPSGTAARGVAAQLAAANGEACTSGSVPFTLGCAYSAASRTLGAVTVGSLPPAPQPGPPGMDSRALVYLSGLTETVRAEEGQRARTPAYTRSGTLAIYNGTGYTNVNITTSTNGSWPIVADVVYTRPNGAQLTLHYEGSVTVSAPAMTYTPATRTGDLKVDCQAEACVSTYNGGSAVVVNMTVDVIDAGTTIGRFGVNTNLGGLLAQSTFKAAADAP